MPTPFEEQVIAIMALLEQNDSAVQCLVGRSCLSEHAQPRRIVFVPTSGRFEVAKGAKHQVAPDATGKPLASIPLFVEAHVYAECFDVAWLLWQNLLTATRTVLKDISSPRSFNFANNDPANAGVNPNTECIVQVWEWRLTAWEGILPLPTGCAVENFVFTTKQQKMLTFELTDRLVTDPNQEL